MNELEALNTLAANDPDQDMHCVQLLEWFDYRWGLAGWLPRSALYAVLAAGQHVCNIWLGLPICMHLSCRSPGRWLNINVLPGCPVGWVQGPRLHGV